MPNLAAYRSFPAICQLHLCASTSEYTGCVVYARCTGQYLSVGFSSAAAAAAVGVALATTATAVAVSTPPSIAVVDAPCCELSRVVSQHIKVSQTCRHGSS